MKKNQKILLWLLIITILSVGYLIEEKENVKIVNTQNVSNKKIGWGIKRANNHEQPDLGSKNIKMLKGSADIIYIFVLFFSKINFFNQQKS